MTMLTLILTAVGIVTPIAWDYLQVSHYSSTSAHFQFTSRWRGPTVEKLQFRYNGRPVAALSKLSFVLSNTGRTPIRSNDIIAPPTITIPDAGVLDVHIQSADSPHLPEDHCGIDSSAGVDRGVAARAIEPPMD
jgi:hypothetical protein